jgi:hypothetical protein
MSEYLFEKVRFRDKGELIYDFTDEFLVECPKCDGMAKIVLAEHYPVKKIRLFAPRRMVCLNCPHTDSWAGRKTAGGRGATDWYFGRPLWLQTGCCGNTLWAYNTRHLDLLESYVAARLRERKPKVKSVASRLPNWMKLAKNRPKILRAIGKLKEKLNGKS